MSVKIISQEGRKLTLQLEIDLEAKSMLTSENKIQSALNELGCIATEQALFQFDTDGKAIEVNGEKLTSKGQEKKDSNAIWSNRS